MNKFFYIYNPDQANYFHMHDIPIIEIGKGKKNDIYIKFPRNNKSEAVFTKWINRCSTINS